MKAATSVFMLVVFLVVAFLIVHFFGPAGFVLAVVGSVIAYIGDRLGTSIGKKRISKLGLRPRHTAMLYTIVSGALIAFITLCALSIIDQNFRQALLGSEKLHKQNHQLEMQISVNEASLRQLQQKLATANANQIAAETREKVAKDEQHLALTKLGGTRLELVRSQIDLTHQQQGLHKAQNALRLAQQNLSDAKLRLDSTRGDLAKTQQAVREKVAVIAKAKSDILSAQRAVLALEHRGDALTARNLDLASQNNRLTNDNAKLTTEKLIYRKGQEVGRSVISANQSTGAIRNELVEYLEQISREAVDREGKVGANNRAVVIAAPGTDQSANATPLNLSENLLIETVAQNIAAQKGVVPSVAIVSKAKFNTFKGEQTQIDVHLYDNVLIFARGSLIATGTIDGTQPEDIILADLQSFLQQSVRPVALSHGVIPTRDPQTNYPSVGAPTDSSLTLALVKQLQQIGSGARVSAYAAEDTYSSGPLRLRLTAAPPASSLSGVSSSTKS